MQILLWIVCIYLALGIMTTVLVSQTPWSDNGWLKITLVWPVYLRAYLS